MTEDNKELFQVILCHWITAREEIKAGTFENDAKMILDEEGEAVNSPMGLMCLGFAAGMHHGLEIARQMNECKRVQDAGELQNHNQHP